MMKMYHTDGRAWREHHNFSFLPRMQSEGWERYKELDLDTKRQVKGIVKGRLRGDHFETIGESVGLNTYYVAHYTHVLGIPTTTAFRMRRLAKLYCLGLSAPEVAKRMGLTVRAVNILRTHLRLPPFPRMERPPRPRSKVGAEVASLVEEGHSLKVRDIAKTLGVSRQTVYNWLSKHEPAAVETLAHSPHGPVASSPTGWPGARKRATATGPK
jgi:transposase